MKAINRFLGRDKRNSRAASAASPDIIPPATLKAAKDFVASLIAKNTTTFVFSVERTVTKRSTCEDERKKADGTKVQRGLRITSKNNREPNPIIINGGSERKPVKSKPQDILAALFRSAFSPRIEASGKQQLAESEKKELADYLFADLLLLKAILKECKDRNIGCYAISENAENIALAVLQELGGISCNGESADVLRVYSGGRGLIFHVEGGIKSLERERLKGKPICIAQIDSSKNGCNSIADDTRTAFDVVYKTKEISKIINASQDLDDEEYYNAQGLTQANLEEITALTNEKARRTLPQALGVADDDQAVVRAQPIPLSTLTVDVDTRELEESETDEEMEQLKRATLNSSNNPAIESLENRLKIARESHLTAAASQPAKEKKPSDLFSDSLFSDADEDNANPPPSSARAASPASLVGSLMSPQQTSQAQGQTPKGKAAVEEGLDAQDVYGNDGVTHRGDRGGATFGSTRSVPPATSPAAAGSSTIPEAYDSSWDEAESSDDEEDSLRGEHPITPYKSTRKNGPAINADPSSARRQVLSPSAVPFDDGEDQAHSSANELEYDENDFGLDPKNISGATGKKSKRVRIDNDEDATLYPQQTQQRQSTWRGRSEDVPVFRRTEDTIRQELVAEINSSDFSPTRPQEAAKRIARGGVNIVLIDLDDYCSEMNYLRTRKASITQDQQKYLSEFLAECKKQNITVQLFSANPKAYVSIFQNVEKKKSGANKTQRLMDRIEEIENANSSPIKPLDILYVDDKLQEIEQYGFDVQEEKPVDFELPYQVKVKGRAGHFVLGEQSTIAYNSHIGDICRASGRRTPTPKKSIDQIIDNLAIEFEIIHRADQVDLGNFMKRLEIAHGHSPHKVQLTDDRSIVFLNSQETDGTRIGIKKFQEDGKEYYQLIEIGQDDQISRARIGDIEFYKQSLVKALDAINLEQQEIHNLYQELVDTNDPRIIHSDDMVSVKKAGEPSYGIQEILSDNQTLVGYQILSVDANDKPQPIHNPDEAILALFALANSVHSIRTENEAELMAEGLKEKGFKNVYIEYATVERADPEAAPENKIFFEEFAKACAKKGLTCVVFNYENNPEYQAGLQELKTRLGDRFKLGLTENALEESFVIYYNDIETPSISENTNTHVGIDNFNSAFYDKYLTANQAQEEQRRALRSQDDTLAWDDLEAGKAAETSSRRPPERRKRTSVQGEKPAGPALYELASGADISSPGNPADSGNLRKTGAQVNPRPITFRAANLRDRTTSDSFQPRNPAALYDFASGDPYASSSRNPTGSLTDLRPTAEQAYSPLPPLARSRGESDLTDRLTQAFGKADALFTEHNDNPSLGSLAERRRGRTERRAQRLAEAEQGVSDDEQDQRRTSRRKLTASQSSNGQSALRGNDGEARRASSTAAGRNFSNANGNGDSESSEVEAGAPLSQRPLRQQNSAQSDQPNTLAGAGTNAQQRLVKGMNALRTNAFPARINPDAILGGSSRTQKVPAPVTSTGASTRSATPDLVDLDATVYDQGSPPSSSDDEATANRLTRTGAIRPNHLNTARLEKRHGSFEDPDIVRDGPTKRPTAEDRDRYQAAAKSFYEFCQQLPYCPRQEEENVYYFHDDSNNEVGVTRDKEKYYFGQYQPGEDEIDQFAMKPDKIPNVAQYKEFAARENAKQAANALKQERVRTASPAAGSSSAQTAGMDGEDESDTDDLSLFESSNHDDLKSSIASDNDGQDTDSDINDELRSEESYGPPPRTGNRLTGGTSYFGDRNYTSQRTPARSHPHEAEDPLATAKEEAQELFRLSSSIKKEIPGITVYKLDGKPLNIGFSTPNELRYQLFSSGNLYLSEETERLEGEKYSSAIKALRAEFLSTILAAADPRASLPLTDLSYETPFVVRDERKRSNWLESNLRGEYTEYKDEKIPPIAGGSDDRAAAGLTAMAPADRLPETRASIPAPLKAPEPRINLRNAAIAKLKKAAEAIAALDLGDNHKQYPIWAANQPASESSIRKTMQGIASKAQKAEDNNYKPFTQADLARLEPSKKQDKLWYERFARRTFGVNGDKITLATYGAPYIDPATEDAKKTAVKAAMDAGATLETAAADNGVSLKRDVESSLFNTVFNDCHFGKDCKILERDFKNIQSKHFSNCEFDTGFFAQYKDADRALLMTNLGFSKEQIRNFDPSTTSYVTANYGQKRFDKNSEISVENFMKLDQKTLSNSIFKREFFEKFSDPDRNILMRQIGLSDEAINSFATSTIENYTAPSFEPKRYSEKEYGTIIPKNSPALLQLPQYSAAQLISSTIGSSRA